MIYMKQYTHKVNYDGEKGEKGRYPLVLDTYVTRNRPIDDELNKTSTFEWKDLKEFIASSRGCSHDFIGELFGGVVFFLNDYEGMICFQYFRDDDQFPESIKAPWLAQHIKDVMLAWRAKESTAFLPSITDSMGCHEEYHPKHEANIKNLAELRARTEDFYNTH